MYPNLPEYQDLHLHLPGCQDWVGQALANHCGRPSLGSCGPAASVKLELAPKGDEKISQHVNATWVFPKNRGVKTPKMDGENNGKPYVFMNDLGGKTPIFGNTHLEIWWIIP